MGESQDLAADFQRMEKRVHGMALRMSSLEVCGYCH